MGNLRILNKYFLKYKVRLGLGFIFVCLNSVLLTFPGLFLGKATNLIEQRFGQNANAEETALLMKYGLYMILFSVAGGFFMFLMRQTIIVMSRLIEYDQKNEIFGHYQQLDQAFYKKNYTGDLMNRISEDVSKVRMYTGPAIMYIANTLATVVTAIIFMVKVDWRMAIVVVAPLPVLSFIIYKVSARINKQSTLVQEQLSAITSHTQESFSGIRVIKAYNREKYFADKFEKQTEDYRKRGMKLALTEAFFQPFMVFMVGMSVVLAIYFGGLLTIKGEIKTGDISSYVFYIYRLTWPFASLGWVTSLIQRASASQKRISEFLNTQPSIKNTSATERVMTGSIEFRNVSFVYPDTGIKAVDDISFCIEAGESVAFIGPTGSGKSTLATLLCRFEEPDGGEILVDRINIKDHNLYAYRRQTGYVPQEVFLFSDTITNNIAFGMESSEAELMKQVEQAAKDAGVYHNITEFSAGFNTIAGERGVMLSGGQKQRISIARAIIKKPALLIFDDCLSAVDTETEDQILANLERIMKGRTSIFISHRVSSIRNCSRIFYMEEGKIKESGTHHELLALNGSYAALFELQNLKN